MAERPTPMSVVQPGCMPQSETEDLPADLLDENCDNFSKRQESVETQVPECDGASSPESQSTPATYHSWTSDVDVFGSPKKQHHLAKLQELDVFRSLVESLDGE
ncbi:unnamed protein product, partial [Symbiodinium pilosum]